MNKEYEKEEEISKEINIAPDKNGKYDFLGYKISELNIKNIVIRAWNGIDAYNYSSTYPNGIFIWGLFQKYYTLMIDKKYKFGTDEHTLQTLSLVTVNHNIPGHLKLYHNIITSVWSSGVIDGKSWFCGRKYKPAGTIVIAEDNWGNNGTTIVATDDWITRYYLIQSMYKAYTLEIESKECKDYEEKLIKDQLNKLLIYAGVIRNPQYSKGINFEHDSDRSIELSIGNHCIGYIKIPDFDEEELKALLEIELKSKGVNYNFEEVKQKLKDFIKNKFN